MSGLPILIGGYRKSGTTLLASLLDGHSQVAVFPEETFFLRKLHREPDLSVAEAVSWLTARRRFGKRLASGRVEGLFGNLDYSDFDHDAWRQQIITQAEASQITHADLLTILVSAYMTQTGQTHKRYWLEKSPGNELYLRFPQAWYADWRFIYVVRDPRDAYLSYARKKKIEGQPTLTVEQFVFDWMRSWQSWQQYHAQGQRGLLIKFESLAESPDETMARLGRFLGIEPEPILLTPTRHGHLWQGNSMHGDKFSQISTKPIGRWRTELADGAVRVIEMYLGGWMDELGYAPAGNNTTPYHRLHHWLTSPNRATLTRFFYHKWTQKTYAPS